MRSLLLATVLWIASTLAAHASLNVVATTSTMGALSNIVGGPYVETTVLAPPDRDAHHLEVRPSMMAHLRRADLVVAVGAELEIGWLPPAISGASNPTINPGTPGYFEGARKVPLRDAGQRADRALGDVHPQGNPHFYFDPLRTAAVAEALAERMGVLRPAHRDAFTANAEAFRAEIEHRMEGWQERTRNVPGIVLYHKDADYLAQRLDILIQGYIEPLPGIAPTAAHLSELVGRLRGRDGVILHATFQPEQGPGFVGRELGWPVRRLTFGVDLDHLDADGYFAFIDRAVSALALGGES